MLFLWNDPSFSFFYFLNLLFLWPHHTACGILVAWPGIEPSTSAVEVRSLNYQGSPSFYFFSFFFFCSPWYVITHVLLKASRRNGIILYFLLKRFHEETLSHAATLHLDDKVTLEGLCNQLPGSLRSQTDGFSFLLRLLWLFNLFTFIAFWVSDFYQVFFFFPPQLGLKYLSDKF